MNLSALVKQLERLEKKLSKFSVSVKTQKTGIMVKHGKHVLAQVPDEQYGKLIADAIENCFHRLSDTVHKRLEDARASCQQIDLFTSYEETNNGNT